MIGYIFEMAEQKKQLEAHQAEIETLSTELMGMAKKCDTTTKALKYALSYIEKSLGEKVTKADYDHVLSMVQEMQKK